jgi:cobalt-zinc-cadmium efflux system outer membrane protein
MKAMPMHVHLTHHPRRFSPTSATRLTVGVALPLCGILTACQPAPRLDLEAATSMGDAVGLSGSVEFRKLSKDDSPLDEPAVSGRLTLPDAMRRAVTTDPALQAALARVRMAVADADQVRLLPNPVMFVVVRFGAGSPQVEASFVQDFMAGLQIPRRASAADNRLRAKAADAVTSALDAAAEVQERYAAAQAASALVPALRTRLKVMEQMTSIADDRLAAGEAGAGDVATLGAQRVSLEVDIERAVLAEREARIRLARVIGEPSSAAVWELDAWTAPPTELQPESSWVNTGLARRPEIQSIGWQLAALGDDKALAHLVPWEEEDALLPLPNPWEPASAGVDYQKDGNDAIGPSFATPVPIFDMGQSRRARVSAEVQAARNDMLTARRKVVEEVRTAYQTLLASTSNLRRIREQLIPLQERRRSISDGAYRAGEADVTVLFLAEQDLRLAQTQAIEVELQSSNALVRLQRAVGGAAAARTLTSASTATNIENTNAPQLTSIEKVNP